MLGAEKKLKELGSLKMRENAIQLSQRNYKQPVLTLQSMRYENLKKSNATSLRKVTLQNCANRVLKNVSLT